MSDEGRIVTGALAGLRARLVFQLGELDHPLKEPEFMRVAELQGRLAAARKGYESTLKAVDELAELLIERGVAEAQ